MGEFWGPVGPSPSFGEPWSCLSTFGTLTGLSKVEHKEKWRSWDPDPFLGIFWFRGYVEPIFSQWIQSAHGKTLYGFDVPLNHKRNTSFRPDRRKN
jgi:hypothetical protein